MSGCGTCGNMMGSCFCPPPGHASRVERLESENAGYRLTIASQSEAIRSLARNVADLSDEVERLRGDLEYAISARDSFEEDDDTIPDVGTCVHGAAGRKCTTCYGMP